jgi:hypothetical protein
VTKSVFEWLAEEWIKRGLLPITDWRACAWLLERNFPHEFALFTVQRHEIGGSTKLEEKVQMVSEAELVEMHQAAAEVARWERHYAGKNPDGRETANKKALIDYGRAQNEAIRETLMPAWLKDSFSQPVHNGATADADVSADL